MVRNTLLLLLLWVPAPVLAQCILANPSFEVGGSPPGGWNHFGPVATAGAAHHGSVAARVLGGDQGLWDASGYWQPLDTASGEQWEATVRVRVDGAMPLTGASVAMVNIEWRSDTDALISYESHVAADANSATDTWLDFSVVSGPAPSGAVSVRLLLGLLQAPGEPQPAVEYDSATFFSQSTPTIDQQQWADFPGGRELEFAGYTWRVKGPGYYGPGPNWFSDDVDNVWVGGDGALHLTLRNEAGTWYSSELALVDALGYGDYIFTTQGDLDTLDPHAVLGLFLWQYGPCWDPGVGWWNPYNEIDVEFSRWGDPGRENLQFTTQPWDWPGNSSAVDASFAPGEITSHAFRWSADAVEYRSWRGGPGDESPASMIHQWTYTGPHTPRPEFARVHLNLWAVFGNPAVDQEVVLTDFTFDAEATATAVATRPTPLTRLEAAVPNPFNPRTQLRYHLDQAGPVRLTVHDVRGRLVAVLADGPRAAGEHLTYWDGRDLGGARVASGVYHVRLVAGDDVEARKITLVE